MRVLRVTFGRFSSGETLNELTPRASPPVTSQVLRGFWAVATVSHVLW